MTDKLPPNLLALFAPRPALRYLPHPDHAPEDRHTSKISPVGEYLEALRNYEDDYKPTESWLQRKDRVKQEQKEKQTKLLTEGVSECESPQSKEGQADCSQIDTSTLQQWFLQANLDQINPAKTRRFEGIPTGHCSSRD